MHAYSSFWKAVRILVNVNSCSFILNLFHSLSGCYIQSLKYELYMYVCIYAFAYNVYNYYCTLCTQKSTYNLHMSSKRSRLTFHFSSENLENFFLLRSSFYLCYFSSWKCGEWRCRWCQICYAKQSKCKSKKQSTIMMLCNLVKIIFARCGENLFNDN